MVVRFWFEKKLKSSEFYLQDTGESLSDPASKQAAHMVPFPQDGNSQVTTPKNALVQYTTLKCTTTNSPLKGKVCKQKFFHHYFSVM